ncbi:TrkH family potassium uptake protein [Limibacillus halophilus]|uniref:Trk system potassium uptake protein n=1 Tax=Limibacillus halophilus TaxID=1579333 RepID=A0A839SPT0_9PROT|nr:TrkH family potassium uptake protein [Limibacillus halophilus]MBB3063939.1 trk system potassium uptake protein TrkH [Limibacillus halophilus]
MPSLRPTFFVLGILLLALAMAMLLPLVADLTVNNPDWSSFALAGAFTTFVGGLLALSNRPGERFSLGLREAFLLTTLSWLVLPLFAAFPFLFFSDRLDLADAFFEAASGLTTTGSTVLVGLDAMPPGILLWRSALQWMGGVGIVVMAIIILPFLRVGGMQLFHAESSDRSEKIVARPAELVGFIVSIYGVLTLACFLAYRVAGMNAFDALNHAMTTLSTGGYSTHDASMAHFQQPAIHWIATVFMLAGALPFVAYVKALRGDRSALWKDSQIITLLSLVALVALSLGVWLSMARAMPVAEAMRHAFFNVASIVTTTGFASDDYSLWGTFAVGIFFFLTFVGGCTGSTSGAIKIFRFQILLLVARRQLRSLYAPHAVVRMTYNGRPVPEDVPQSVLAFLAFFGLAFACVTLALTALGLDLVTAISGAAQAISNVGPGLGDIIGPSGNFSGLGDAEKMVLSGAMILGRLELFTLLVLLDSGFWRW